MDTTKNCGLGTAPVRWAPATGPASPGRQDTQRELCGGLAGCASRAVCAPFAATPGTHLGAGGGGSARLSVHSSASLCLCLAAPTCASERSPNPPVGGSLGRPISELVSL